MQQRHLWCGISPMVIFAQFNVTSQNWNGNEYKNGHYSEVSLYLVKISPSKRFPPFLIVGFDVDF
jgi:hypothetical protein